MTVYQARAADEAGGAPETRPEDGRAEDGRAEDGRAALAAARAALGFDPLTLAREVALEAGDLASRWFRLGARTPAKIWSKEGGSPVTEADVSVDTYLKVKLSAAGGTVGWLSEESHDDRRRLGHDLVWVIDPIDGTRAFMAGDPAWSVVVALVAGGRPIAGVVHGPACGETFEAEAGGPALLNGRPVRATGATRLDGATILGPKGFLDGLAEGEPGMVRGPRVPSLALRLARVGGGQADGGVVSSGAHDWDLAASDLILERAGARLTTLDGDAPRYNRPVPDHGVLVAAGPGLEGPLRAALAESLRPRRGAAVPA